MVPATVDDTAPKPGSARLRKHTGAISSIPPYIRSLLRCDAIRRGRSVRGKLILCDSSQNCGSQTSIFRALRRALKEHSAALPASSLGEFAPPPRDGSDGGRGTHSFGANTNMQSGAICRPTITDLAKLHEFFPNLAVAVTLRSSAFQLSSRRSVRRHPFANVPL